MTETAEALGKSLAAHLLQQSGHDSAVTPMNAVLDCARQAKYTDDHGF